jgi:glycosyltransferase 2 family protein
MDIPQEHEVGAGRPPTARRGGRWRGANALFGILLLAALWVVIHNIDAERRFAMLLTHAAPGWLLVAVGYQVSTYVCAAGVWVRVLRRAGVPLRVRALIPLGLAKLCVDQVVPTAGVGGTLLVVHGLMRRGVPQGLVTAALLMDLLSFYAAHGLAIVLALLILWTSHHLPPAVLILATLFSAVATMVPLAILWLTRRGDRTMPPWVRRLPGSARLLEALAAVPADVMRDSTRLLQTTLLQCAIVALDAATLDAALRAVGHPARPAAVFASFTMASVVATLSLIPGGLGIFEAVSVVLLRLLDVPVEAGLAATLLLRAATFWLPMVPGLWIVRREHP